NDLQTAALGVGHYASGLPVQKSWATDVMGSAVVDFRGKRRNYRFAPFVRGGFGVVDSSFTTPAFHCCAAPPPPPGATSTTTFRDWVYSFGTGVRVPIRYGLGVRPEVRYSRTIGSFASTIGDTQSDHWVRVFIGFYFLHEQKRTGSKP